MHRALLLLFLLAPLSCHAQVQTSSHNVSLTWSQPTASGSWTGCTTAAPCVYIISKLAVASGATSCPAPNLAAPNYTPLNSGNPATGLSYTDTSSEGSTVCYIAQTQQGIAVSVPSATAGPLVVPANPLAPSINGTVATNEPSVVAPSSKVGVVALKAELTR